MTRMVYKQQYNSGFFMVDDYIDDVLENYFSIGQVIQTIGNIYQPSNVPNLDPRHLLLAIGSLADSNKSSDDKIKFESVKEELNKIEIDK